VEKKSEPLLQIIFVIVDLSSYSFRYYYVVFLSRCMESNNHEGTSDCVQSYVIHQGDDANDVGDSVGRLLHEVPLHLDN
jgi:hypothetical protein